MKTIHFILLVLLITFFSCSKSPNPSASSTTTVSPMVGTFTGVSHYHQHDVSGGPGGTIVYDRDSVFPDTINVISMPGDSMLVIYLKLYDWREVYPVIDTVKRNSYRSYYIRYISDINDDNISQPSLDSLYRRYKYFDGATYFISHYCEFYGKKI